MIELLVTLAIIAILVAIGAPSMQSWIMGQRVSAIGTEILTDFQLARSEAITRDRQVRILFKTAPGLTCYTIYMPFTQSGTTACDCTSGSANACPPPPAGVDVEIKTARFPDSNGVTVTTSKPILRFFANGRFDTGATAMNVVVSEKDGGSKILQVQASAAVQRPTACVPSGSTLSGFKPC